MWQGIVGHDPVYEYFRECLRRGRIASTYLFLGPPGVGKRTFARKLAQALLCLQPEELMPCGQCESCRLFQADNHPDLNFIQLPEGKQKLPVELFIGDREHRNHAGLCHDISMRPMLGGRRVAIIDDADYLTTESANCLLKTLEEPPPHAVLILLGTSRGRQLPTILSRSQIVRFAPLETDTLERLLLEHQLVEDSAQAARLAQLGEGSMAKAVELADPQLLEIQQRLIAGLGNPRADCSRMADELNEFVSEAGKEASARRQRLRTLFQLTLNHFRQLLLQALGTQVADVQRSAPSLSTEAILAAMDRTIDAENELDRNANQATLLECWLDDLTESLLGGQIAR